MLEEVGAVAAGRERRCWGWGQRSGRRGSWSVPGLPPGLSLSPGAAGVAAAFVGLSAAAGGGGLMDEAISWCPRTI